MLTAKEPRVPTATASPARSVTGARRQGHGVGTVIGGRPGSAGGREVVRDDDRSGVSGGIGRPDRSGGDDAGRDRRATTRRGHLHEGSGQSGNLDRELAREGDRECVRVWCITAGHVNGGECGGRSLRFGAGVVLNGADVGAAGASARAVAALVGGEVLGIGTRADRGARRLEGDGLGRPAVIRQAGGGELGIDADEVARALDRVGRGSGLDQAIGRVDRAGVILGAVIGEERADGIDRAAGLEHAPDGAAARLGVECDRAVEEADRAAVDIERRCGSVAGLAGLAARTVAFAVAPALTARSAAAARSARDGVGRHRILLHRERAVSDIKGASERLAAGAAVTARPAGGKAADIRTATGRCLVPGVMTTASGVMFPAALARRHHCRCRRCYRFPCRCPCRSRRSR